MLKTLFKPTDGIVSRKLNRHISLQVTRALLKWPVTPNQMTVVAALFGLAAILVVAIRGTSGLIPGALLLLVQSILDGCDGEISRLKYLRSRLGEWLDQLFDDAVNVGYFAAVGYTLYRAGSVPAGWITLVGVISHLIYQAALYAALLTRGGGSGSVTSIRWWGQKAAPTSQPAAGKRGIKQVVDDLIEMGARRDFHLPLPALRATARRPGRGDLVGGDFPGIGSDDGSAVGVCGGAREGGEGGRAVRRERAGDAKDERPKHLRPLHFLRPTAFPPSGRRNLLPPAGRREQYLGLGVILRSIDIGPANTGQRNRRELVCRDQLSHAEGD